MIRIIIIVVLSLIGIVLYKNWKQKSLSQGHSISPKSIDIAQNTALRNISVASKSFGYKISWLAIKSEDRDLIIKALDLKELHDEEWIQGLEAAYNDPVNTLFVTPSVNGWTFVVGFALGEFDLRKEYNKKFIDFLNTLGKQIPDFYYFSSYRVSDYYAWVAVKEGAIQRAYSTIQAEVAVDIGEQTIEEKNLNFNFVKNDDDYDLFTKNDENGDEQNLRFVDEEDVISIATAWSINPLDLDSEPHSKDLGTVGKIQQVVVFD